MATENPLAAREARMADPINVLFHSPCACAISPMVYLHWGASTLLDDLKSALPRMRTGDVDFACARFIGCCHEKIDGSKSLGCSNLFLPPPDENATNEQIYQQIMAEVPDEIARVNVDDWTVSLNGETIALPADLAARADGCGG